MGNLVTPTNSYSAFEEACIITNPKILAEQQAYKEMQQAQENLMRNTKTFKHNVPKHHLEHWPLRDVMQEELKTDDESPETGRRHRRGNGGKRAAARSSHDELATPSGYTEDSDLYALYPELSVTLDEFKLVVKAMKTKLKREHYAEIQQMLSSHVHIPYSTCEDREQRRLMAYHMTKLGFAKVASAYYAHVLAEEKVRSFAAQKKTPMNGSDGRSLLRLLREVIWKLCGGNYKLAYKFGQAGFLQFMIEDLQELKPFIKKGGDEMVKFATNSALGILCNCAKGDSNKKYYQELNAVERVRPYFHSSDTGIKTAAVLTLTYIVDEVKHPQLLTDENVITYMMTVLYEACHQPTRQTRGYSALDLVKGLNLLAVNDLNKSLIMKKEIIPCLMKLLQVGDPYEKEAAATIIWTLAFDSNNKKKFQSDLQLMALLDKVRTSPSSRRDEKAAVEGALWVLRGQDAYVAEEKRKPTGVNRSLIMLSYNWADQRVALLIRDALRKAKHDVWVDIEHLDKPMPRARIEAISTAAFVIVCVSNKYKQAPVSRTELRYSAELHKRLLPVAVQRDYRPDGWLQHTLQGAQLYDLGSTGSFDTNMPELLKDLSELIGSKI